MSAYTLLRRAGLFSVCMFLHALVSKVDRGGGRVGLPPPSLCPLLGRSQPELITQRWESLDVPVGVEEGDVEIKEGFFSSGKQLVLMAEWISWRTGEWVWLGLAPSICETRWWSIWLRWSPGSSDKVWRLKEVPFGAWRPAGAGKLLFFLVLGFYAIRWKLNVLQGAFTAVSWVSWWHESLFFFLLVCACV